MCQVKHIMIFFYKKNKKIEKYIILISKLDYILPQKYLN